MAEIVRMPKLSDTMTEGVVAEWHKKVGDKVESGDLLAEIETDKATMEFESFQDGTLLYIGVEKGSTAPVDSVLCILGDEGEDYKALLEQGGSGASEEETSTKEEAPKVETTPAPAPKAEPKQQEAPKPAPAPVAVATDGKVKASPLAKKVAEDKGINLSQVQG